MNIVGNSGAAEEPDVPSRMGTSFDANGRPCFLILLSYDNEAELTFSHMHARVPGAKSMTRPCGTDRCSALL